MSKRRSKSKRSKSKRSKDRRSKSRREKSRRSKNRREKSRRSKNRREIIVDPVFSKKSHKGTMASPCEIGYHYQSYDTFSEYIKAFLEVNPKIKSYVFTTGEPSDMMLELNISTGDVYPIYISKSNMLSHIKEAMSTNVTLIPIIFNIKIPDNPNHANVFMINKRTRNIELFEPHGSRSTDSTLGGYVGGYTKKVRYIKKYWADILPEYTVINAVDVINRSAFQTTRDPVDHSGYCVTWSLIYMQYRILNPTLTYRNLIQHIDTNITTKMLLRFAREVEDTLKSA